MGTLNLFDLSGKVSMVSGGGDGIGRAMALALAEAGSNVVVFSRRGKEKCEEVAQGNHGHGWGPWPSGADVSKARTSNR